MRCASKGSTGNLVVFPFTVIYGSVLCNLLNKPQRRIDSLEEMRGSLSYLYFQLKYRLFNNILIYCNLLCCTFDKISLNMKKIIGQPKCEDQQITCTFTGSTGNLLIFTFLLTSASLHYTWPMHCLNMKYRVT